MYIYVDIMTKDLLKQYNNYYSNVSNEYVYI